MKRHLTAIAVERMKPPAEGRAEYFDTVLPGFCLRVTDKGKKTWTLVYRFGGRLTRLTLGRYPVLKLDEAREVARQLLQALERGENPAEMRRQEEAEKEETRRNTVASVVDEFIERYAKPKNRRWADTRRVFENHVLPRWGNRPITAIGKRDVVELLDAVMDRGTPYMANHVLASVRKLFNWAAERGIIEVSPCVYIKAPAKVVSRDRVLGDDEIKRVWKAATAMDYPFGPLVKLLLTAAQRRDEVATMRWSEIDFDAAMWTIPRDKTKSGRAQEVPLSALALKLVKALPRQSGPYLFSTLGGERPVSGHSKAKAKIDELSEVTEWRLHDLRRTAATNMARLGVPTSTISRVLNHAESGVTAIYDRHSYLPEKRKALEAWAERLEELVREEENAKTKHNESAS